MIFSKAKPGIGWRNICACVFMLSTTLIVTAKPSLAAYQKPKNSRVTTTETLPTGVRSETFSQDGLPLTLLAPKYHVGSTQLTHPTFAWYIPVETPLDVEFQVYEILGPDDFQKVLDTPVTFTSNQGVMSYTLPQDMDGLKPCTEYVWEISLQYGTQRNETTEASAQIRVTEDAHAPTPFSGESLEPAEQLAASGLWYDALGLLLTDIPAGPEANRLRDNLLTELAAIEAIDEAEAADDIEDTNEAEAANEAEATEPDDSGLSHSQSILEIINRLREP
ncbi:MAG: DUF928 domain-containing protein [Cyanobacteria bacterium P01_F01_bin.86]